MPISPETIQLLSKAGVVAVLLLIVFAMATGYVVPKYIYESIVKDRDFWRDAYLRIVGKLKEAKSPSATGDTGNVTAASREE